MEKTVCQIQDWTNYANEVQADIESVQGPVPNPPQNEETYLADKGKHEITDQGAQLAAVRKAKLDELKDLEGQSKARSSLINDLRSKADDHSTRVVGQQARALELENDLRYSRERVEVRRHEAQDFECQYDAKDKDLRFAAGKLSEQEIRSLQAEMSAVEKARSSAESQFQSLCQDLSEARIEIDTLKRSSESTIRSIQMQISNAKSEIDSLRELFEKEVQSFRNELSVEIEMKDSLAKSKQELIAKIEVAATHSLEIKSPLIYLHIFT